VYSTPSNPEQSTSTAIRCCCAVPKTVNKTPTLTCRSPIIRTDGGGSILCPKGDQVRRGHPALHRPHRGQHRQREDHVFEPLREVQERHLPADRARREVAQRQRGKSAGADVQGSQEVGHALSELCHADHAAVAHRPNQQEAKNNGALHF